MQSTLLEKIRELNSRKNKKKKITEFAYHILKNVKFKEM